MSCCGNKQIPIQISRNIIHQPLKLNIIKINFNKTVANAIKPSNDRERHRV